MARRGKGGGGGAGVGDAAWRRGAARPRLLAVSAVAWALLLLAFHLWSCASPAAYSLSAFCRKDSRVVHALDPMGTPSKPLHRCSIPVADDPDAVVIPKRTPNAIVKKLSYLTVDKRDKDSPPLFGGRQTWKQREESFKLNATMKVHCGFMKNSGADMGAVDFEYIQKCKFVVASGIFDGYDVPHQPSNISFRSQKLFCFLMVVDEVSFDFIEQNVTVKVDSAGGKWVGIWRLVTLHRPPFDEPRRNGKVPKILTHRLFPQAWYSIWIDGKMELMVDPLLILERYLWRGKYTFAVAVHKHHRSIYEEGDAIKRRKRYARPLVDLQMKIYYHEGMEPWDEKKRMPSDIPEGAVLIREHTTITDLFSCLWFNEVNLFTPRDQLSFGYVAHRLGDALKFFMFPNCEYNSLFILHRHTREHSSKVEWAKTIDEILKKGLKESRGGLGLWTPYPADLSSVELPAVKRTSQAS
ncbi:hypothetical protein CFC21_100617 [Triticum aestivum]|uniref:TOD1/MUCI70 glycosyltransferase-like domain-containing protein n=3 Tax=Triticum TaxID=4564 RepID=A0A9R0ZQX6_TRITD|nr:probable hexosyltransferase MUCI70 [Triticum aestivum]KAF7098929.1 hypothetical protein CFC21_100617 [Triticum aestivum]VAI81596.1 unnamed protein product [Triticum turgidum subsp. durum]